MVCGMEADKIRFSFPSMFHNLYFNIYDTLTSLGQTKFMHLTD